jgi:hypothetical protein
MPAIPATVLGKLLGSSGWALLFTRAEAAGVLPLDGAASRSQPEVINQAIHTTHQPTRIGSRLLDKALHIFLSPQFLRGCVWIGQPHQKLFIVVALEANAMG